MDIKNPANLEFMQFRCEKSEGYFSVLANDISINSSESPCDLCGSHGYVEIEVYCPFCKKYHTIRLKEF